MPPSSSHVATDGKTSSFFYGWVIFHLLYSFKEAWGLRSIFAIRAILVLSSLSGEDFYHIQCKNLCDLCVESQFTPLDKNIIFFRKTSLQPWWWLLWVHRAACYGKTSLWFLAALSSGWKDLLGYTLTLLEVLPKDHPTSAWGSFSGWGDRRWEPVLFSSLANFDSFIFPLIPAYKVVFFLPFKLVSFSQYLFIWS